MIVTFHALKPKKVEMAYVPSDWVKIVQEARAKNPFIVNHCSQDIFMNRKQSSSCIKTRFTDQTGQTLFFRDVVMVRVKSIAVSLAV